MAAVGRIVLFTAFVSSIVSLPSPPPLYIPLPTTTSTARKNYVIPRFRFIYIYIYMYVYFTFSALLRSVFFLVSRYPDSQHSILARMPLNQYAGRHSFSSRNSSRTDGTVRLSSWIFFFDSTGLSLLTFEFGIASRGVDYIFVDHRFIQGLGRFRKYRLDFPRQSLLSSLPT